MTQISVNRYQYGVGQGCFHAQEINLGSNNIFRLIYDCGGKKLDRDWCISHFTNQVNDDNSSKKIVIDVFYLSHFEQDHLNGLKALSRKSTIKKIVLPHIDKNDVLTLIAQQLFIYNSIASTYLRDLTNVAQGNSIDGLDGIPIIQVQPNDSSPPDSEPSTDNTTELGGQPITEDLPKSSGTIGNKRITLTSKRVFWELLHWAYKPSDTQEFSALVITKLKEKFNSIPESIDEICKWIDGKYEQIKEAYQAALDEYNQTAPNKIETNHNIVSLCLYSGPSKVDLKHYHSNSLAHWWPRYFCDACERSNHYKDCFCGIRLGAWLGTGDAMLGLNDVWSQFENYFNKRLDLCSTVLVPHHGAGAQSSLNYRSELIKHNRNCVISAGANNRYQHPHKDVLMDILSRNGRLILVNENNRLGFMEHLIFE